VENFFFMLPRTGRRSSKVITLLQAFWCISWACAFGAGVDASIFFSGPAEAEEKHSFALSQSWLYWKIMAHPPLGKEVSVSPSRWL
jgi:hypothetical protein